MMRSVQNTESTNSYITDNCLIKQTVVQKIEYLQGLFCIHKTTGKKKGKIIMATMYNFEVELIASEETCLQPLIDWAAETLSEDEQARLEKLDPEADNNWMGFIPAVFNRDLKEIRDMAGRAFCDGARMEMADEKAVAYLWYHGADSCNELFSFLGKTEPSIKSIRVYADPDERMDVEELGEDDLFSWKRV